MDCPVGSNFVPIEKIPIPIVALDASQKYLSDCQKPFGSKVGVGARLTENSELSYVISS